MHLKYLSDSGDEYEINLISKIWIQNVSLTYYASRVSLNEAGPAVINLVFSSTDFV